MDRVFDSKRPADRCVADPSPLLEIGANAGGFVRDSDENVTINSQEELEGLRRVSRVVAEARDSMVAALRPGVTTGELDAIGRDTMRRHGARSAPRVTYNFPGFTCISINDEAAHGIPSLTRHVHDGDLVNIDVSAELDGFWSDTGISTAVGTVPGVATKLIEATSIASRDAMDAARAGERIGSIGRVVYTRARRYGFRTIKNLCGHGLGSALHQHPSIPNYDDGQRGRLHEGMVLAVEPFLSVSAQVVVEDRDGWTLRTSDGSLVAQCEHTMVVTAGAPMVLTA